MLARTAARRRCRPGEWSRSSRCSSGQAAGYTTLVYALKISAQSLFVAPRRFAARFRLNCRTQVWRQLRKPRLALQAAIAKSGVVVAWLTATVSVGGVGRLQLAGRLVLITGR